MKKLLGISLVAVLAVAPLMANADPVGTGTGVSYTPASISNPSADQKTAVTAAGAPYYALVEANSQTDNNAASAGYVKGAYNAAIKAVNAVHEEAAAASALAATKQDALSAEQLAAINAGASAVQSVAEGSANGTIAVDGTDVAVHGLGSAAYTASTDYEAAGTTSAAIAGLDASASQTAGTDGLALSVTEVDGKITAISGSIASGTYATAAQGATAEAAAAAIGTAQLSTTAQTLTEAVNELKAGADAGANALQKADITTGSTAGTIAVDGTDVAVQGLGSAAYTASSDYDAAGAASGVQTAIENKLDDGVNGYNIDAASLKVQGVDVLTQHQSLANYATKTGVENTIKGATVAVTDNRTISTTVPIMTDWSNPNTATTLTGTSTFSGAAPTASITAANYATANPS